MASQAVRDGLFRWAEDLPSELWDDLGARPPLDASQAVGGHWHDGLFRVPLLGMDHILDPQARRVWIDGRPGERVSYQAGVVLLSTLTHSLGVPASGRMVTPAELPGGKLFFTGAHAPACGPLAKAFDQAPEDLWTRAQARGAERVEQPADLAFRLPGLPNVPLYALFWDGEQDFAPRAVIGIDDRAPFHLDLGGVLALTNLLVRGLIRD